MTNYDWLPGWHKSYEKHKDIKKLYLDNLDHGRGTYPVTECDECHKESMKRIWELNWRIIDAFPQHFTDPTFIMKGPTALIMLDDTSIAVTAQKRALEFDYSFELINNKKAIGQSEEDILDWIMTKLIREFQKFFYNLDGVYCPYVPIEPIKAVDQDTFQPKIGFTTRYGVIDDKTLLSCFGTTDIEAIKSGDYDRTVDKEAEMF